MYEPIWSEETTSRQEIDEEAGKLVLEFGAEWCPHCQEVQSLLKSHMQTNSIPHLKFADGRGKALGRTFSVKLWPNFVFLQDGQILHQLARPSLEELEESLVKFALEAD